MTTVTFDDAVVAMQAVIGSTVASYPVKQENAGQETGFPPEPPAPWVQLAFRHVMGEQMSIGAPDNNFHEDRGAMIAYVFVPVGSGDVVARQVCDAVVALYRGKTFSSVEILDIHGDDGGGVTEDGNWWRRWRRIEFLYRLTA